MLGMQILDALNAMDIAASIDDLNDKEIILAGEGLGGLWAILCGIFRPEIKAVVTVNTLPSYMLLLSDKYFT
jgi:cephalosporin-C deacetylase-like acetyl esterase